ncbi:MAG: YabP/YqfC family sporulation protein [Clostridia bacterium]|nr:YabP/YqfC family sporulation protein [Clostridia bacterium]
MKFRKKREKRTSWFRRIVQPPEGVFDGLPYLELHGDSSMTITGYEMLMIYEENELMFRMKPNKVDCNFLRIRGRGLLLHAVSDGVLTISGRIDEIILHPTQEVLNAAD